MGGLAWSWGARLFPSCSLPLGPGSPAFSEGCSQMPGPHHSQPCWVSSLQRVMDIKQHIVIQLR